MESVGYDVVELVRFLLNHGVRVLNVAGNRERTNPGIYQLTYDTLTKAFKGGQA